MTLHAALKALWDALPKEARPEDVWIEDDTDFCFGEGHGKRVLSDDQATAMLCHAAEGWLSHTLGLILRISQCSVLDVCVELQHQLDDTPFAEVSGDTKPAALAAAVKAVKEWRAE